MMLRKFAISALVLSLATSVWAEPIRTQLTKENRFPELWRTGPVDYHFEGGASFLINTFDDGDAEALAPYIRLRPLEDLVLFAEYPLVNIDRDINVTRNNINRGGDRNTWKPDRRPGG